MLSFTIAGEDGNIADRANRDATVREREAWRQPRAFNAEFQKDAGVAGIPRSLTVASRC